MSWVRIPSVTLLPSLTTSCCEGFFVLPLSSRIPSFPVVRRLLCGTMRFLQRDAGACRCVRVASSAFCRSALPVVPRLLGCRPLFGAVCACAHERRARVGDIGVNLSARSHREIRESIKTCSLSRDLSALRAAAVLRFPPVNEFAPRARIYTRASVAFRFFAFTPSPCGTLGWLLIV